MFTTKYYSSYQINDNEMDRACGTYGKEKRYAYRVLVKKT
jgi:hypothetical protein